MVTGDAAHARSPFVGVWNLESFTEQSKSSEELNPLGAAPVGFLIYTANGFVSAQLMRRDRKALGTDPWAPAESGQGANLANGYIPYCGAYAVDEERGEVIHMPIVSLLPNLINRNQHRSFTFERDSLTLVTKQKDASGSIVESRLVWRRSH
ncbi:lipocalin-like domain-containing protein [Tunturibacter empetritectus]